MKLNFFTPLPDLRTEIANMAATVLPELAKLAEVRAWTAQETWRDGLEEGYEIRRFDPAAPPIYVFNWADVNFYNIGNEARYHRAIFDMARRMPGIHILHDVRLPDMFAAYLGGTYEDRHYYKQEMAEAGLEDEVELFLAGKLPVAQLAALEPMTQAALRPALGAVVHNAVEMAALAKTAAVPLFHVPLCLCQKMPPVPGCAARRFGEGQPVRLIVFGFIGRNCCLPQVLQALAGMPERARYVLDIYGVLEAPEVIRGMIVALGLQDSVVEHGFVSDAVLDAALQRADLAINLRNPTMGEASASQLRIWANCLPSVVSDVSWYGTLAADAVFRVAVGDEVEGLRACLQALCEEPERFRQAGLRGRALLERAHRPEDYARALAEIAGQAPQMHARRNALVMARRAASALWQVTGGGPIEPLTPAVAARIHEITRLRPED